MLHAEHPGHDEKGRRRAELDLRLAELGRVRCHRIVAGHGEVTTTAETIAVYSSHDGQTRAPHPQPSLISVLGVVAPILHGRTRPLSRRNVKAGAERLACPGDDHGAHIVVTLAYIHRGPEVGKQLVRERVHLLRPVQGQDHERAVVLQLNVLVGHRPSWAVVVRGMTRASSTMAPRPRGNTATGFRSTASSTSA